MQNTKVEKPKSFQFADIELYRIPTGPLPTNTYLLVKNGQSLLVDPGNDAEKLANLIKETKTQLQAILITHAHWDHVGAVENLRKDIKVYLHPEAKEQFARAAQAAARWNFVIEQPKPADHDLLPGEQQIGEFKFKALFTSGHAPGHLAFYFAEGFVLSGDALFKNSIGRTDFPESDHNLLIKNIKEQLFTLPAQTVVFSGHGDETTIELEVKNNPYVR